MTDVYEETREVHHSAEETPFGRLYAAGQLSRPAYADWVAFQLEVHGALDDFLPWYLRRKPTLLLDLLELNEPAAQAPEATWSLLDPILDSLPDYCGAAAYVFLGAHLRGGAKILPALEKARLPCHHLYFDEAARGREWLRGLRGYPAIIEPAKQVFRDTILAMDEIYKRHYSYEDEPLRHHAATG